MKRNAKTFFVMSVILGWTITVSGQDGKVELLKRKNLTYYWIGISCPYFEDTVGQYRFNIECAGCIRTRKIDRNNKRVIKEVEKAYGKNWFRDHIQNFEKRYGHQQRSYTGANS